jgi:hypothetical protein
MIPIASLLIGAVVWLICVAIFAVILRGISKKRPNRPLQSALLE